MYVCSTSNKSKLQIQYTGLSPMSQISLSYTLTYKLQYVFFFLRKNKNKNLT